MNLELIIMTIYLLWPIATMIALALAIKHKKTATGNMYRSAAISLIICTSVLHLLFTPVYTCEIPARDATGLMITVIAALVLYACLLSTRPTPSRFPLIDIFAVTVVLLTYGALNWPQKGSGSAPLAYCLSNMKQITLAMVMYSTDYDDRMYPVDSDWSELAMPYLKNNTWDSLTCPEAQKGTGYGLNEATTGLSYEEMISPPELVIHFEVESDNSNFIGGRKDIALRHINRQNEKRQTLASPMDMQKVT